MFLIMLLAVLGYVTVSVGIMRPAYLHQYKSLRTPQNGVQMSVIDAKRNAVRSAAGWAFSWPLLLCMGTLFVPLFVLFDVVPAAGKAVGRGVAAGATTTLPVIGAPVLAWVTAPVEREVAHEAQLALEARASDPAPDVPLVPDEISTWTPPVKVTDKRAKFGTDPFDDPMVVRRSRSDELDRLIAELDRKGRP